MFAGLSAFFASLGFAILFNIRKRKLFVAAMIGALGGVTYHLFLYLGKSNFFFFDLFYMPQLYLEVHL